MPNYSYRPCRCGSGEIHYPLIDRKGIFCCYACDACVKEKKAGYAFGVFDDDDDEAAVDYPAEEQIDPEEYYGSQYEDWY
jgi:hypothetical protein